MKIGILALQGDYAAHARALQQLDINSILVRDIDDLHQIAGLIIPGGESTTLLKLLDRSFISALQSLPKQGKPIFGTCAGAILLAKEILNPKQASLGLVDITIERNSYGRQVDSQIQFGKCQLQETPLEMVFIRAPKIRKVGSGVDIIATFENEPVCVRQELCLIATFHPELTDNLCLHQYFLKM